MIRTVMEMLTEAHGIFLSWPSNFLFIANNAFHKIPSSKSSCIARRSFHSSPSQKYSPLGSLLLHQMGDSNGPPRRGGILLGILKCICCGKPKTTDITQLLINLLHAVP
ncbi:hypothetical protein NL676_027817 [Syzygium grande]|nr:hypothetical protein NL676_027817 [Syzygium grande]